MKRRIAALPTAGMHQKPPASERHWEASASSRLEQAGVRLSAAAAKLGELWMPFQEEYDVAQPDARAAIVVSFVDKYKDDLPALIKEAQAVDDLFAEFGIVTP